MNRQVVFGLIVTVISLVGLICVIVGNTVLVAVGTSLIASGFVGLLELTYRSVVREDTTRTDAMIAGGLYSVYHHRDLDRYHSFMHEPWERLDIFGYSLRNFFDSFGQRVLERADADQRVRVRILVVDPASAPSKAKEAAEGHVPGTFLQAIESIKAKYGGRSNVEIRLLKEELTTMVFRIDNVMFVGPQFRSAPSKATLTLELHKGRDTWLYSAYEGEFTLMWAEAGKQQDGGRNE